ncbi:hypothetical protein NM208_g3439 [Fusarium decemcellulare]|uniref:Uncharacterized protein n=1 Tax=Fusarium decemcellulare TaxID=57161 RepID=A0ACC1SNZ5_9HYPO|nr:hypothetical protein NM208_g3439 [Fusarium decemcellulare]
MDLIEDLIITPFSEMIENGHIAIHNAGTAQPMLRIAEALVREADRAMRRIQRLAQKRILRHGLDFVHAVQDSESIAKHHIELVEILWDFEDYNSCRTFQPEIFAHVQFTLHEKALGIYQTLARLKLGDAGSVDSLQGDSHMWRSRHEDELLTDTRPFRNEPECTRARQDISKETYNDDTSSDLVSDTEPATMVTFVERLRALSQLESRPMEPTGDFTSECDSSECSTWQEPGEGLSPPKSGDKSSTGKWSTASNCLGQHIDLAQPVLIHDSEAERRLLMPALVGYRDSTLPMRLGTDFSQHGGDNSCD